MAEQVVGTHQGKYANSPATNNRTNIGTHQSQTTGQIWEPASHTYQARSLKTHQAQTGQGMGTHSQVTYNRTRVGELTNNKTRNGKLPVTNNTTMDAEIASNTTESQAISPMHKHNQTLRTCNSCTCGTQPTLSSTLSYNGTTELEKATSALNTTRTKPQPTNTILV
jgi:hypothetical protein